jgi:hypothetical protein
MLSQEMQCRSLTNYEVKCNFFVEEAMHSLPFLNQSHDGSSGPQRGVPHNSHEMKVRLWIEISAK